MSSGTDGTITNGFATQLKLWLETAFYSSYIWRLIPMKVEDKSTPPRPSSATPGSGSLPSYDGDGSGQSSTRGQHVESERDDYGTIITEFTTTTTVVTSRKKYRVEDD